MIPKIKKIIIFSFGLNAIVYSHTYDFCTTLQLLKIAGWTMFALVTIVPTTIFEFFAYSLRAEATKMRNGDLDFLHIEMEKNYISVPWYRTLLRRFVDLHQLGSTLGLRKRFGFPTLVSRGQSISKNPTLVAFRGTNRHF